MCLEDIIRSRGQDQPWSDLIVVGSSSWSENYCTEPNNSSEFRCETGLPNGGFSFVKLPEDSQWSCWSTHSPRKLKKEQKKLKKECPVHRKVPSFSVLKGLFVTVTGSYIKVHPFWYQKVIPQKRNTTVDQPSQFRGPRKWKRQRATTKMPSPKTQGTAARFSSGVTSFVEVVDLTSPCLFGFVCLASKTRLSGNLESIHSQATQAKRSRPSTTLEKPLPMLFPCCFGQAVGTKRFCDFTVVGVSWNTKPATFAQAFCCAYYCKLAEAFFLGAHNLSGCTTTVVRVRWEGGEQQEEAKWDLNS